MSAAATAASVRVEIYGQGYSLRGTDSAYFEELADYVDAKMRAVSQNGTTVDTLRVAVLAALNIADEMHTARRKYESLTGDLNRAAALSGMLDRALESERRAG